MCILKNKKGDVCGFIDSNGNIVGAGARIIAKYNDRKIFSPSGECMANIDENGNIIAVCGINKGKIRKDGTIFNEKGEYIGRYDKN